MADKTIPDLPANTNPSDAALYEVSDGAVSGRVLNTDIGQVRKVSGALIGGDFTGDARGTLAIDIQTYRSAVAQVASGGYAIAVGIGCLASGYKSAVIGYGATASGNYSLSVGKGTTAGGDYATAVGYNASASGYKATAIGYGATVGGDSSLSIGNNTTVGGVNAAAIGYNASATGENSLAVGKGSLANSLGSVALGVNAITIAPTVSVIAPPIAVPQTTGDFVLAGGVEVVLMTVETDLKAVADVTLTIPTGAHFWLDEIGVIATVVDTMSVQPTIRFGITGTLAKQKAEAITTLLTAALKRESYTPLVPQDGETTLTAGVTTGATATEMQGRFYFKGLLVEDQ